MATLKSPEAIAWKQKLDACDQSWIVALVHPENYSSERPPQGLLGILDWRLRGRLSELLHKEEILPGGCSILASHNRLGKAKLLLYRWSAEAALAPLLLCLQRLQVREVCLADATFPADFLGQLRHNLEKEGVRWVALESKKV